MIESLATLLAFAAFAGAIASWIVGAIHFGRCLHALAGDGRPPHAWLATVAWPFALKRLHGAAAEQAARTNKALVAFLACLMIGAAATSVAVNLHRVSS